MGDIPSGPSNPDNLPESSEPEDTSTLFQQLASLPPFLSKEIRRKILSKSDRLIIDVRHFAKEVGLSPDPVSFWRHGPPPWAGAEWDEAVKKARREFLMPTGDKYILSLHGVIEGNVGEEYAGGEIIIKHVDIKGETTEQLAVSTPSLENTKEFLDATRFKRKDDCLDYTRDFKSAGTIGGIVGNRHEIKISEGLDPLREGRRILNDLRSARRSGQV